MTLGGGKKAPKPNATATKISGAKRLQKAVSKAAGSDKAKPSTKKLASTVEKVMKFTPAKNKAPKGKQSTSGKKPAASPGGKKSTVGTTDHMTMQTLKKFMKFQKGSKGKVAKPAGKVSKK